MTELQREYHRDYKRNRKADYKSIRDDLKVEVLTHYGKEGTLRCCWDGCEITDIDMLTLDHVANDGVTDLQGSGRRFTGYALYRRSKTDGYPNRFQTLCFNHQWKKEIARRG